MVLRAIPEKDPKVKMANVKQSFQRAKQAVDLDDSNGLNVGLGNFQTSFEGFIAICTF